MCRATSLRGAARSPAAPAAAPAAGLGKASAPRCYEPPSRILAPAALGGGAPGLPASSRDGLGAFRSHPRVVITSVAIVYLIRHRLHDAPLFLVRFASSPVHRQQQHQPVDFSLLRLWGAGECAQGVQPRGANPQHLAGTRTYLLAASTWLPTAVAPAVWTLARSCPTRSAGPPPLLAGPGC